MYGSNTSYDVYPSIDLSNPALSLTGRVAIITGAGRGIGGKGIVPAFARAGPRGLVLVGTKRDALRTVEAAVREINPAVETLVVAANIADAAWVARLFAEVATTFGHADILVNNGGVNTGGGFLDEEDTEAWWQNFEVNTKGAFLLAREFLRSLPSPASTPATLVNLASTGAWQVYPTMSGYSLSKLAALQLTAHVAAAYPHVTAVVLRPGLVETDMLLDAFRRFSLYSPALIGGVAVWLAAERPRFLSGRTIVANWDLHDLQKRAAEIEGGGLLKIDRQGEFGKGPFSS
ncbi:hypothetical protein B0T18DRAFT_436491 [Schizothecium vesticola]|uniref:NAD(P)-binding protein n=1 Tax=Schizothecium vesticola TaxID=314040 RepID=A0AA40F7A1_9PEZI|nr:hypothetical protein B0T18DRAFT_436491 [Schizothecium vesticola]